MSHIFISYSHHDREYAGSLAQALVEQGFSIWFDEHIGTGDRWFKTIVSAIRDSSAIVVIMTPKAEESEWVEKEILLAQKYQKPIFPLLLEGKEFDLLITAQFVDVRDRQLPQPAFYTQLPQPTNPTGSIITAKSVSHALGSNNARLFQPTRKRSWLARAVVLIVVAAVAIVIILSRTGPWLPAAAQDEGDLGSLGEGDISQVLVRTRDFGANFWSVGSHEYTISLDCANDIYDLESTNGFEVSENAPLTGGTVQLRASGLVREDNHSSINVIHPTQPTRAEITASVKGPIAEVYRIYTTDLQQCQGFISWDGSEPEVMAGISASVQISE